MCVQNFAPSLVERQHCPAKQQSQNTMKTTTTTTSILCLWITVTICMWQATECWPVQQQQQQQRAKVGDVIAADGTRISYQRFVRRRKPAVLDGHEIYEIREIYYVPPSTTTPRPNTIELDDDEMDRMIRCDFDPTLEECSYVGRPSDAVQQNVPRQPIMTTTTTTSTTTTRPTTSTTTTTTTTTTTQAPTTSTIATTTTDLPFLPELPASAEYDELETATATEETKDDDGTEAETEADVDVDVDDEETGDDIDNILENVDNGDDLDNGIDMDADVDDNADDEYADDGHMGTLVVD